MEIHVVTCSGANEHTDFVGLFNLVEQNPAIDVEIGIPVSGSNASYGTAKFWWLKALYYYQLSTKKTIDLSLHLCCDWVESFCKGDVPDEVDELLSLRNHDGLHFISAVQLNFKVGREKAPKLTHLIEVLKRYPDQQFILSYNDNNAETIAQLRDRGMDFDVLYDDSFGGGQLPKHWKKPVFTDVMQGYSGGFSPENVYAELEKISKVVPKKRSVFIDAEGLLKGPDGYFCLKRADMFVKEVVRWINNH